MRKNIPSILLLLFSTGLFAQENKPAENSDFKHELGLTLFSVTNIAIPGETKFHVYPDDVYDLTNFNVPSGVYYKLHSGKNALRLSYDYFQRSHTESEYIDLSNLIFENPVHPNACTYTYTGIKKEHEFKIGYQRTIGSKRFTGFFFADLIANYNTFAGTNEYNWHPEETYYSNPLYYEQYKAGIALGGGLKYKITKRISVSYEFSFAGVYTNTKDLAYRNSSRVTDLSVKLNPVRMIGVGYSF